MPINFFYNYFIRFIFIKTILKITNSKTIFHYQILIKTQIIRQHLFKLIQKLFF